MHFLNSQNTRILTHDCAISYLSKMILNFAENHKGNQQTHINSSDNPTKEEIQRGSGAEVILAEEPQCSIQPVLTLTNPHLYPSSFWILSLLLQGLATGQTGKVIGFGLAEFQLWLLHFRGRSLSFHSCQTGY